MTPRPLLARALFGALLLAGCASAPPAPDRLDLGAAPVLAVAAPASDRVFVVLRDASLVVLDAAAMQAHFVAGVAPLAPTCAAVDAAGWFAIGGNDGTARLLDAKAPDWERAVQLAARNRPLTAIGVLAAADAAAATATPPVGLHALLASFPGDLQGARVLGANAAAGTAAAVELRPATPTPAPAHVRALAVDPVARRWYVLADGAIASLDADTAATVARADGRAAVEGPSPPPDFALAAPGAHALAWSGSELVVAGDDGVHCHDPATGATTALPATDGARMACVVASAALAAIAALDEDGALRLWRRDGGAWQRVPTPTDLPPARALAFAEPSRRLLVACGPAAGQAGSVRRIDLPPLPLPPAAP
ncbi:MAG: hypothetical protein ACK56S_02465 [Planctomycetota bacterium]